MKLFIKNAPWEELEPNSLTQLFSQQHHPNESQMVLPNANKNKWEKHNEFYGTSWAPRPRQVRPTAPVFCGITGQTKTTWIRIMRKKEKEKEDVKSSKKDEVVVEIEKQKILKKISM